MQYTYTPPLSLAAFPEELLERILAFAVVAPPTPHPRAPWHTASSSSSSSTQTQPRTRLAPLLVSRAFHRIAHPLFYHTLVLHTPAQAQSLRRALIAHPHLVRAVRSLVLLTPDADILALVGSNIRALDVTLAPDDEAALAAALRQPMPALRALAVRKAPGTYLSQPAPRAVLAALAAAIPASPLLESTTTSFPLSADPAVGAFIAALAVAPSLRTLRTPLPALWTPALLEVAGNPTLTEICLGDDARVGAPVRTNSYPCLPSFPSPSSSPSLSSPSSPRKEEDACPSSSPPADQEAPARPILGTGLFLASARKHARLAELIRAGTPSIVGWRGRAWTVGAASAVAVC